jgi:1-deoxy-D-xylulose-5-phosphate reductoisomerase
MAICNAANEVAVEAFLAERVRFTDIPVLIEGVLESMPVVEPTSLAVVEAADNEARVQAVALLTEMTGKPKDVSLA